MKNYFILIFLFMAIFCCFSQADEWRDIDIGREVAWGFVHLIDYGQTLNIANDPDNYYEINPIIGKHPSRSDVHKYMISGMIIHPIITHILPVKYRLFGADVPLRSIFQNITLAVSSGLVTHNYHIGLMVKF